MNRFQAIILLVLILALLLTFLSYILSQNRIIVFSFLCDKVRNRPRWSRWFLFILGWALIFFSLQLFYNS
jgi:threonine/homoserine/homoserine lactone efflux protein